MNRVADTSWAYEQGPERQRLVQEIARRLEGHSWMRHCHDAYEKGETIWFTFPNGNKRVTNFLNTYLKPILFRFNYWAVERLEKKPNYLQRKKEAKRLLSDPQKREDLRYLLSEARRKSDSHKGPEAEEVVRTVLNVFIDDKPALTVSNKDKSLLVMIAHELLYRDPEFKNIYWSAR
ncbi:MAG: hypothetical protein J5I65_06435 [Aridibacter famidurans]|nr:hypothetical protein [Aridibacter famidurans]